MSHAPTESRWQFSIPAWLLSLIVHLSSFLILATVIQSAKQPAAIEPVRAGEIVLFRPDSQKHAQYFQQGAAEAPTATEAVAESGKGSALPDSIAITPFSRDIALPEQTGFLPVADSGVVQTATGGASSKRTFAPNSTSDDQFVADEQARLNRARKALGPTTTVSIFGSKPIEGRSFVFVIDRSKSMGGEGLDAIDAASKELKLGLSKLTEQHQFQIIAYNHETHFLSERKMLAATDDNKQSIKKFFDELAAFGGTEHELAISAALRLKPDVVFVLTDGGDPELNEGQLQWIRQQAGTKTVIHCLQFGSGSLQESDNFLMKIARQNGGTFRYIDMAKR